MLPGYVNSYNDYSGNLPRKTIVKVDFCTVTFIVKILFHSLHSSDSESFFIPQKEVNYTPAPAAVRVLVVLPTLSVARLPSDSCWLRNSANFATLDRRVAEEEMHLNRFFRDSLITNMN